MLSFQSHATDDEGYTHSILVDGKNILTKWGIEFSDGDHFFIHGLKDPRFKFNYSVKKLVRKKNETYAHLIVKLSKATIDVELFEIFTPALITRKYFITPQQEVHFMDISISQAFPKELFSRIEINGNPIQFNQKNRNYQFETEQACLKGASFDLDINFMSETRGTQLIPVIYGRINPQNDWVVHSRLFPEKATKKAVIWCHPLRPGRIPLSDMLSKIDPLVEYLWYAGEKPDLATRKTLGLASIGLAKVSQNTRIEMTQTIQLKPHTMKPPFSSEILKKKTDLNMNLEK